MYEVSVTGDLCRSEDETKRAGWYDVEEIKRLGDRSEQYNSGEITEEDWERDPGLEPVMHEWFKELKII